MTGGETFTRTGGWRVTCSVCSQQAEEAATLTGAVELAEATGWRVVEIRRRHATLCPQCYAAWQQRTEAYP